MEKLVSTQEAATILGLSLQGIHYRIKHNQLKAMKKSGKTYVYLPDHLQQKERPSHPNQHDHQLLLQLKDEQIHLLKDSLTYMKQQHTQEIKRLEKSQKRLTKVFSNQIQLLQQAFNEMRSIYKQNHTPLTHSHAVHSETLSIKEFFQKMNAAGKNNMEIKQIIYHQLKKGDLRFKLDKIKKELIIQEDSYKDLLHK